MESNNQLQETTHYDYILVGTGLVESILSCALAKRGKKVLHFDQNDYYGELFVSGNLSNMMKYFHPDQVHEDDANTANTGMKQNPAIPGSIAAHKCSNFLLVPEVTSDPTQSQSLKQLRLLQIYQRYFSRYYPANKKSSYLHPTYFHLLTKPDPSHSNPSVLKPENEPGETLHPAFQSLITLGEEEQFLQLLIHLDRYFNLDLSPKMIYCSGKLINAIVQSNTHHYFEFKPLNSFYYFLTDPKVATAKTPFQLWKVPSNKNDIFLSTHLSALEKRTLMKFYQYIFDWSKLQKGDNLLLLNEKELMSGRALYRPQNKSVAVNPTTGNTDTTDSTTETTTKDSKPDIIYNGINYKDKTFLEFLQAFKLSDKLQWTIVYALCLHYGALTTPTTTNSMDMVLNKPIHDCLADLSLYFNSIGIFGDMAFLTPLYGIGEIVQGFCRMSAVWGTTFMLRQTISSVTSFKLTDTITTTVAREETEKSEQAEEGSKNELIDNENENEEEEDAESQKKSSPSLPATLQVTDRDGQVYTCHKLIANMSYFPSTVTCSPYFSYHFVVILGLSPTTSNNTTTSNNSSNNSTNDHPAALAAFFPEERSVGIIPPHFLYHSSNNSNSNNSTSLQNPYAIYIHQYDHSTESAPVGMTLLHFHTILPDPTTSSNNSNDSLLEHWESRASSQFPVAQALTQQLLQLLSLREAVTVVDWKSSNTTNSSNSSNTSNDYQVLFSRDFLRPVTSPTWQYHPITNNNHHHVILTPSLDFSSLHCEHEVELAHQILYELLVVSPEERDQLPLSDFKLFEDEKRPTATGEEGDEAEMGVPTGTGEFESEEAMEASEYMKLYQSYVVPATTTIDKPNEEVVREKEEDQVERH